MQAKQLSCLYRHPTAAAAVSFPLIALQVPSPPPQLIIPTPSHLSSHRAVYIPPAALRVLNTPPHSPTLQHQHHGNWTHRSAKPSPNLPPRPPSPESSGADERGREKERLHLHTGAALPCIASLHGLGARTTIWLSEALLEKELLIERNEREKEEDRDRARSEETAIYKPRHTSLDWGILDIAADLIASL
ncbi:hypothetical protein Q7P36_003568 [Cladosporium allicinum]